MIDFHTHILPGIDDGSPDMDTTLLMLQAQKDAGIHALCATPHFCANKNTIESFLNAREAALSKTIQALPPDKAYPQIIAGAEVDYYPGIGSDPHIKKLCIAHTHVLLVKMPLRKWGSMVISDLEELIRRKFSVVLTHWEKYLDIKGNKNGLARIEELPFIAQINAETLLHNGKKQKRALNIINSSRRCILASDCHNLTNRPPNLAPAFCVVEEKIDPVIAVEAELFMKELLKL